MAYPQFSETQFVISFLREYLNQFPFYPDSFWLYNNIRLPSTVKEKETGADFILDHLYSHSVFFQFKRSHKIHYKGKGFLNKPEKNLSKSFFDYYRFEIYNSNSRQFEKLRDISTINSNDISYYVAPLFYSLTNFNDYFHKQEILNNSVMIPCEQFRDTIFNPPHFDIRIGRHFIVYNDRLQGFLLSEPKEIKVLKASRENKLSFQQEVGIGIKKINNILKWCKTDLVENYGENSALNESFSISEAMAYLSNQYNIIWQPIFR